MLKTKYLFFVRIRHKLGTADSGMPRDEQLQAADVESEKHLLCMNRHALSGIKTKPLLRGVECATAGERSIFFIKEQASGALRRTSGFS